MGSIQIQTEIPGPVGRAQVERRATTVCAGAFDAAASERSAA